MSSAIPEAVAEKILFWHGLFGHERSLIQVAIGDVPHREVMRAIELLGTKVAPRSSPLCAPTEA